MKDWTKEQIIKADKMLTMYNKRDLNNKYRIIQLYNVLCMLGLLIVSGIILLMN
jgi:hypothetical protein